MIFGGLEKFTLIDFPGTPACVLYTIGCNFRCPYCHNPELVDETVEVTYTEADIIEFLRSRAAMLEGVVITGGEPTMHEELPQFMQTVKDLGFKVKLDSNGTNPDMLRQIIDKKLADYIAMDIKSPLARYSNTVARPVDLQAIKESINVLMTSDVLYEFRTTVIKALLSPEDIETIGKEIQGAKRYYLQKFVPTKLLNPQFIRKTTYSDDEFVAFQNKLNHYVEFCGIR